MSLRTELFGFMIAVATKISEGKGEGIPLAPPRCRNGVNSPYLPA